MANNQKLHDVKELIASEQYQEALNVILAHIDNCNHTNEAYILKAKALAGLGRICEIENSLGHRINWKNPSRNDLTMVELTEKSFEANNWILARYQLNHTHNLMLKTPKNPMNVEVTTKIDANLQALNDRPTDDQVFLDLTWLYFAQNDIVKSAFYQIAYRHFCQVPIPINELDSSISLSYSPNISDIYMYLTSKVNDTIAFIIERDEDTYEYEKMAQTLLLMNKKVIIIRVSSEITVDTEDNEDNKYNEYNIEHFLNLSFVKKEIKDGIEYYPAFQITRNGVKVENTALPLLNKIAENSGNHLPVFAEQSTLDNLKSQHTSRKEIHYVCNGFNFKNAESCTCFAYIRGYEQYISKLYDIDVKSQLTAKSECAISIILPVRNNVTTLPHTLKTCMEQSFSDYEIVVSDNSDEGNNSVYELINELKCDKIKYYKTPRNLPLAKSFEYAYLQAKGEFLVPIGADDGILYNGLKTIDKALQRYPDEDILLWDRLHYVWPNFMFENQSNQFIFPKPYTPNSFNIKKVNCLETLISVLQFKQSIYGVPLLYINSGMKRRYLLKMLDRTGAIIDGMSQDVYTGIVNLSINKEFIFLPYPITIAGLSSNSTGGISSAGNSDLKVQQKRVDELLNTNFGHHMPRKLESIIPTATKVGDISNIIMSVLRLIDMQCINTKMLHCIDWKQAFRKITEQHHANDINLETSISRLLDAAKDISPEIYNWYAGELRSNKLRFISDKPDSKKTYYKGFGPNSSLSLDASDFGISNVYEAARFASKLLNL